MCIHSLLVSLLRNVTDHCPFRESRVQKAKEVGQSVLERWRGKTSSIEAQLGEFVTRVTPWRSSTMSVSLDILVSWMDKA